MTSRDVGILTTDAGLLVRSWNDWLERATGVRAADAVGRPLATLAEGLETRGFLHRLEDVLRAGSVQVLSPVFHKYLIPCPPRTPSRFFERMQQHVTIGPLVDNEGRTTGLVITIEDVTPRLEHERELTRSVADSTGFDTIAASLRDDDWRVRRAAVDELSRSAAPDLLHALLDELRRSHRNFSALSSALRLLARTKHDLTAPLAALLNDPDPDLRMQVALALGEQSDAAAAEPLLGALGDPDQNVRFHVIEALGRLRAVSAVDALVDIAESDDFFLAFAALDALALIHDPRVATRLVRLMDKPDVREAAIGMLAAIGDMQVAEALAAVVNASPEAAPSAAQALVRIHEREAGRGERQSPVPALVAGVLDQHGRRHLSAALNQPAARRGALVVLGWLKDETFAEQFVRFIDSDDRDAAIDGLVALGEVGAEHLLACCRGDESTIEPAAVAALGQVGSRRVTPTLLQLLDGRGPIGVAAAGALAKLADPEAFDGLIARAGHPDAAIRQAVVGAINSLGHPDLPTRTLDLLTSEDPLRRESGVKIAGYFGFAGLTNHVVRLTQDPVEAVRIAAVEHLPFIAVDGADARLTEQLRDETPRGRAAIVRTLARYDTPHATAALISALADPDLWVRYYAARSLAGRREPETVSALVAAADESNHEPIRVAAMDSLASAEGPEVDRVLLAACEDRNPDVAAAALRAAGERRTEHSLSVLQRHARGEPGPRTSAALEGLARDGSTKAIEMLQWMAASTGDDATAGACTTHLGQLARAGRHGAAAVDALLALSLIPGRLDVARDVLIGLPAERIPDVARALGQPFAALRQRAVSVLGELRHPQATAHLLQALEDVDPAVRETAVAALGQLGARKAQPRLAQLASTDPSAAVRRAAAEAVASFGRTQ